MGLRQASPRPWPGGSANRVDARRLPSVCSAIRRDGATMRDGSITQSMEARAMIDDMGILRTTLEMAALERPDRRQILVDVMVDTGSEYSWAPEALLADLGV